MLTGGLSSKINMGMWPGLINIYILQPQSLHIMLIIFNCSLISKVRPFRPADIPAVKVCILTLTELASNYRSSGWSGSQARPEQIVSIVS